MCGIAGMIGPGASLERVDRMLALQHHRGPDGEGRWAGPGIALGHRRLRILDLSDAGAQPMTTPDGRYTIVYNGEVYNFRELRREFSDVTWRSQTDTEVVLQAFAAWGPACVERLIGMFAFAIWDRVEQRAFLVRDRLGVKPLYYAQVEGGWAFASELKPLLALLPAAEANAGVVYDFLARDFYGHTDETFFCGIRQVPAAHWMTMRDQGPERFQRYWSLADEAARVTVPRDPREREEAWLALARESVGLRLVSDVPVGVALSGGVDSATLLFLMRESHASSEAMRAFSFTFEEPAYSEERAVEQLVAALGTGATYVRLTPRAVRDATQDACEVQEEPFAGVPIIAYGACFRAARERGTIVMLDGSGVDEGLAGYERFLPAHWADLDAAGRRQELAQEWAASGIVSPEAQVRATEEMRAARSAAGDIGKGQDRSQSVQAACLDPAFAAGAARSVPQFDRPFPDALRNLMYRELIYTKLPRALRFRDRLSMAVGSELRTPFLDHRLLAFEFALPAEERIQGGRGKALLRRAMARRLPDPRWEAPKHTVQTPQREWFRGELSAWVRERLDSSSFWRRGWIEPARGRAALERFLRGEGDNSFFIWQWINLELWAERFLDAGRAEPTAASARGARA